MNGLRVIDFKKRDVVKNLFIRLYGNLTYVIEYAHMVIWPQM